jgi:transposase-like protein
VIERAFKEVRRRTNVVGRFPTPMSALVVAWAAIEQDRLKWRGIHMDAEHGEMINAALVELKKKPIVVKGFEWLKAA